MDAIGDLPSVTEVLADSVVLEVELGGTIVEHERGVRAAEQAVLSVGFPATCSWCGDAAVAVVPGRLWRSCCSRCGERRSRPTMSRAEAIAVLGVDVSFVDVPGETPGLRRHGVAKAGLMWSLSVLLSLVTWRASADSAALTAANAGAVSSSFALLATARSRSARPHAIWFLAQCGCLTLASVAVRLLG